MLSEEEHQMPNASWYSNPLPANSKLASTTRSRAPKNNSNKGAAKNTKNNRLVCSHYGIVGHTRDQGYKIHSYPFNYIKQPSLASIHQVDVKLPNAANLQLSIAQYLQLLQLFSFQVSATQPATNVSNSIRTS